MWREPLLKGLGFCCILGSVAWLGQRANREATYGPELAPAREPSTQVSPPASATPIATDRAAPDSGAGSEGHRAGPSQPTAPPPCTGEERGPATSALDKPSAFLPDGRLIMNEATAADFDRLPGIGAKRAADIIALRERLKGFKRITDLLRVRGIGPRSLASLKELLVLDRPAQPPEPPPAGDAAAPTRP